MALLEQVLAAVFLCHSCSFEGQKKIISGNGGPYEELHIHTSYKEMRVRQMCCLLCSCYNMHFNTRLRQYKYQVLHSYCLICLILWSSRVTGLNLERRLNVVHGIFFFRKKFRALKLIRIFLLTSVRLGSILGLEFPHYEKTKMHLSHSSPSYLEVFGTCNAGGPMAVLQVLQGRTSGWQLLVLSRALLLRYKQIYLGWLLHSLIRKICE